MAARSTTPTTSPITVRNTEEQTWASHLAQERKEYLADKRWRRELEYRTGLEGQKTRTGTREWPA